MLSPQLLFEVNCNFVIARSNKINEQMKKYVKIFSQKAGKKVTA